MAGRFVTFEGPDGCGKSTQAKLLFEHLVAKGYRAVYTREPGGTRISEVIRGLVLDPANREMADRTEVLLYAASRAQHVEEFIRPALSDDKTVICDRFVDSSLVYQGFGLLDDVAAVRAVNDFATAGLKPDLTILLDVDPGVGLARVGRRGRGEQPGQDGDLGGVDRIERRLEEYHQRVRAGYLALAQDEPDRIKVIVTGERPVHEIAREVRTVVAASWPGFPVE